MVSFRNYLENIYPIPVLLNGPLSSEIQKRGYLPHPVFDVASAAVNDYQNLTLIYEDYLRSGSQILTSNTIKTSEYLLKKAALPQIFAEDWAAESVRLTQKVIQKNLNDNPGRSPLFTAGNIGPLEPYASGVVLSENEFIDYHSKSIRVITDLHVDLVLAEQIALRSEARAIAYASKANKSEFTAISFLLGPSGEELMSGDDLIETINEVVSMGTQCILFNCATFTQIDKALKLTRKRFGSSVMLGACPNIEFLDDEDKSTSRFVQSVTSLYKSHGLQVLGGCNGASPRFIKALSKELTFVS